MYIKISVDLYKVEHQLLLGLYYKVNDIGVIKRAMSSLNDISVLFTDGDLDVSIAKGIENAAAVLVCVSAKYQESKYCKKGERC